jgi:hypothetical protein
MNSLRACTSIAVVMPHDQPAALSLSAMISQYFMELLRSDSMKYWEIMADNLSKAGWSWAIAAPLPEMAGVGLLTPVPERVGLKSYIRLSGVRVKTPSITSSDVSTHLRHG